MNVMNLMGKLLMATISAIAVMTTTESFASCGPFPCQLQKQFQKQLPQLQKFLPPVLNHKTPQQSQQFPPPSQSINASRRDCTYPPASHEEYWRGYDPRLDRNGAFGAQIQKMERDAERACEAQELAHLETKRQEAIRVEAVRQQQEAENTILNQQRAQKEREDEDCRQQCRGKLNAMLTELRALKLDEAGIKEYYDLGQRHTDLVKSFPPDVREELKSLDDEFSSDFLNQATTVAEAERDLKKKTETGEQLLLLYSSYLMMQTCTEHYPQFDNLKTELQNVIKAQEAELKLTAEQVNAIWNEVSGKFQQIESILNLRPDYQIYNDCDQMTKVTGFMMLQMGVNNAPRKRDF
jgi:hypothetical protein